MSKQLQSVMHDLSAIANGMTGDLTASNVANIALDKMSQIADEAEVLRLKAMELSSFETYFYDALQASDHPWDRRTKAWKDHEKARQAANIAWMDFNNALRNIGLGLLDGNRAYQTTKKQLTA